MAVGFGYREAALEKCQGPSHRDHGSLQQPPVVGNHVADFPGKGREPGLEPGKFSLLGRGGSGQKGRQGCLAQAPGAGFVGDDLAAVVIKLFHACHHLHLVLDRGLEPLGLERHDARTLLFQQPDHLFHARPPGVQKLNKP